jgi:hypothetical protein
MLCYSTDNALATNIVGCLATSEAEEARIRLLAQRDPIADCPIHNSACLLDQLARFVILNEGKR